MLLHSFMNRLVGISKFSEAEKRRNGREAADKVRTTNYLSDVFISYATVLCGDLLIRKASASLPLLRCER